MKLTQKQEAWFNSFPMNGRLKLDLPVTDRILLQIQITCIYYSDTFTELRVTSLTTKEFLAYSSAEHKELKGKKRWLKSLTTSFFDH